MWRIHGKQYDLTHFMDDHPGGRYILEKTKDLDDCTALFETYHAFSDMEKIQKRLALYEIEGSIQKPYTPNFTQYRELTKHVQTVYPDRKSIKANTHWVANNLLTFIVGALAFYLCYLSRVALLYKILSQIVYSVCESSLMFNFLHDGSHYGISMDPTWNHRLAKVSSSFHLWNVNAWFFHHVYYHHSFTGLESDIDVNLYDYKMPKCLSNMVSKTTVMQTLYQLFPGQQIIQGLLYMFIPSRGYFISDKLRFPTIEYYDDIDIAILIGKCYILYQGGWIQFAIHAFILNTLYFINVYPNHSSYETKIENHYEGHDWAKMQICNSGNFVMDNLWWTRAFGSINYQIEHHLFPNMSSIHYPAVSKIVRKYCKEHNIPYVNKATLYDAYVSFTKYVNHEP